jgi:hypothetical protein
MLLRYTVLNLRALNLCGELQYFLVYLCYGINCRVTAVTYLACEDVALVYECVGVVILVLVAKRSFRGC